MVEYDSIMQGGVREVVPRPEGKSWLTSRWIVAKRVLRHVASTVEQRLHYIREDAALQWEFDSTGD